MPLQVPTKSSRISRRKRDASPQTLLRHLLDTIEDDAPKPYTDALNALIERGPLVCRTADATWAPESRAVVLAFLKSVVGDGRFDRESSGIGTYGSMTFRGQLLDDGRVICSVDGGAADLVVLQLIVLLQLVGLRNVRVCAAPDCKRLFVKRYRQTYCSTRCQSRANHQLQRRNRREKRARDRARRRQSNN
jgi:hypothetical protein